LVVPNPDIDLAALDERHLVHAERFNQFHTHVGEAFGIARQEFREHTFDGLGRRRDLDHAGVPAFEQFDPFAERVHLPQHPPAIAQELLAPRGEEQAAADPVEQPEPAFVFEIGNLPRQRGLADAQTQRRLRHSAEVSDCNERSQALYVHGLSPDCIINSTIMYWTAKQVVLSLHRPASSQCFCQYPWAARRFREGGPSSRAAWEANHENEIVYSPRGPLRHSACAHGRHLRAAAGRTYQAARDRLRLGRAAR
jgi:hypothetical protein